MPKCEKLCNDSRIIKNAYKVFVFANISEKCCLVERYFEDANVRKFCNDYRIIENVDKMLLLKSVRCENSFSL